MKTTFIVTSYNIAPYIDQCLNSLVPCLRPGDEVILVDDGSSDLTDAMVERRFAKGFGSGVATQLILLGTNTMGGVGIPANIGLARATGEAVFFVDGDDWLEPLGFAACRDAFEAKRPDILICNYLEHDEATGQARPPSDINRWSLVAAAEGDDEKLRMLALSMIAVPWRKFYRRDFLNRAGLRFPEGDFFFEDNPFHWAVCRAAGSISFHDRILCRHRMNRPGQTMAATGVEFLAFFDHFETICRTISPADSVLRAAALEWLVNNMSWHISRMNQGVFWAYATRAAGVLEDQASDWATIRNRYARSAIGGMVEALVRGQIAGTVAAWMADRTLVTLGAFEMRLTSTVADRDTRAEDMASRVEQMTDQVQALRLIEEFRALRTLHDSISIETNLP